MRSGLYGILVCLAATAITMAQSPDGGVNSGNPGEGGRGGRGRMMGPPPNVMFQAIDIDGDGTITKVELRKAVAALKNLDTDGDGNITLAEVTPMGGMRGDPAEFVDRMMENDKNGDGKLTADELTGRMAEQLFQDGDQNGDGALDGAELTAAMENMRRRRGGPGGAGGPGGPGGPGGANFDPQQMTGRMLQQYDQNGDGNLSPNELPQEAVRHASAPPTKMAMVCFLPPNYRPSPSGWASSSAAILAAVGLIAATAAANAALAATRATRQTRHPISRSDAHRARRSACLPTPVVSVPDAPSSGHHRSQR